MAYVQSMQYLPYKTKLLGILTKYSVQCGYSLLHNVYCFGR